MLIAHKNIQHILIANPVIARQVWRVEQVLSQDPTFIHLTNRGYNFFWKGSFDRTVELKCTLKGKGKQQVFTRTLKDGTHKRQYTMAVGTILDQCCKIF